MCNTRNLICSVATLLILSGCSTAMLNQTNRLIGRSTSETQVTRILCLWEPAQGTGTDGRPARGFSGQILFFGPNDDAGARVSGTVSILEYDVYDPSDDDPSPLHTFRFEADAWDVHRTEGSLGHSYSVFIPYMQKHKDPVNCGMKVVFENPDGRSTGSEITHVLLPGRTTMAAGNTLQRNIKVTNSSDRPRPSRTEGKAETTRSDRDAADEELETTTIHLPLPRSTGKQVSPAD